MKKSLLTLCLIACTSANATIANNGGLTFCTVDNVAVHLTIDWKSRFIEVDGTYKYKIASITYSGRYINVRSTSYIDANGDKTFFVLMSRPDGDFSTTTSNSKHNKFTTSRLTCTNET